MTKALQYVEIDVPVWSPSVVLLSFERSAVDRNTEGFVHTWARNNGAVVDAGGGALGLGDINLHDANSLSPPGAYVTTSGATTASELDLSDGDWTIEFYFWNQSTSAATHDMCGRRLGVAGASTTRQFNIDINSGTGFVTARVFVGSTVFALTGTSNQAGPATRWHHCSFVRLGNILKLFIDGVMESSLEIVGAINNPAAELVIGRDGDDTTTYFDGWIDEFSVHRYARRTIDFTPALAGSGDSLAPWQGSARLALTAMLNFDGDFFDTAQPNRVWTAAGNAQIDSSDKVFGSGALLCDGTGDWITAPDSLALTIGTLDFTIEFWVKFAASGVFYYFCGQVDAAGAGSTNSSWFFQRDTSNNIAFVPLVGAGGFSAVQTTNGEVIGGVWMHVAVSRISGTLTLYINGGAVQTNTANYSINDSSANIGIGSLGGFTGNPLNGRIDEFQIYIGRATRTADFAVPQHQFRYELETYRFAIDAGYLPSSIDAIPSLLDIKTDPAIISLGQDLGTRATVDLTFRDHRYIFDGESFDSGTFWGKFRARHGLKLRGYLLRVIMGELGDAITDMETRYYIIESTDGPSADGKFKIVAKDILKFADGDRSQAPVPSNGFLVANITNVATTCTLSPAGIGDAEYPVSGLVAIGGSEICSFTRGVPTSGDVLTLTRAQKNTVAVAHNAQDRVQLVLQYTSQDAGTIIRDLLINYAGVPTEYITLANWTLELNTYLSTVYTATIAEPTSVADLISELIEQVGLVIWWDDISQQIKLQVLRPISSDADVYSGDNYLAGTLKITEQPEKRLTQVYTYFAKLNALVEQDQLTNYRSTSYAIDAEAEADYGTPVIKKIFSRWIPDGGRAVADTLGSVLLARFRDPPRRIAFNVLRNTGTAPVLGVGYQVEGWPIQDIGGGSAMVPAQITSLEPRADIFSIELEEISENTFTTGGVSPNEHDIIFDSNLNNVNLRTVHDSIYGIPDSGVNVVCTINAGVIIGSTSTSTTNPAFDVGTWPAGVTVLIVNNGRIQGKGGAGGNGAALTGGAGGAGGTGGTAIKTTQAFTLNNISGQIWGGGGGGGGNGGNGSVIGDQTFYGVAGGGGGAGTNPGAGGAHSNGSSGINATNGSAGTSEAGGAGGNAQGATGFGGAGGGPGLSGAAGSAGGGLGTGTGGGGGTRGVALDGVSLIVFAGGSSPNGDIRGRQIN